MKITEFAIAPTDKHSTISLGDNGLLTKHYSQSAISRRNESFTNQFVYVVSNEIIDEGDWCLYNTNHDFKSPKWELFKCGKIEREEMHPISKGKLLLWCKKIEKTTNTDLIKEGIPEISSEEVEFFFENFN